MKYNLSKIMSRAWQYYYSAKMDGYEVIFGELLHKSWYYEKAKNANNEILEKAIAENGISEEVNTWSGWQKLGREVRHNEKMVMQVTLFRKTEGKNVSYKASYFTASQTVPLGSQPAKEKVSKRKKIS